MAWVAAAGPGMNIALALVAALLFQVSQQMIDERQAIKIQSRADYEREQEAIEASKIVLPKAPALGDAKSVARFLAKLNLIGPHLAAATETNPEIFENIVKSGALEIDRFALSAAMNKSTLDLDDKFMVKARLNRLGILD